MKISSALALVLAAFLGSAPAKPGEVFPPLPVDATQKIDAAIAKQKALPTARPRRVLIFDRTEGFVHKSIPFGTYALVELGKKTGAYESVVSGDMAMFDAAKLRTFDAVIFMSTTRLAFPDPAQREALLDFVRGGGGIVGIHAATDCFENWPEMESVMGGIFHGHPWTSKDVVAVKLDEPAHPLNAAFGGKGFWIRDEIYQIMGSYSRDRQRVLMSLDMTRPQNARPSKPGAKAKIERTDNDFPVGWVKEEGKGRVFYCSLGHNEDVFWQPEVLKIYLDGIQWVLGDLKADATPSAKISPKPEPALAPEMPRALQDRSE